MVRSDRVLSLHFCLHGVRIFWSEEEVRLSWPICLWSLNSQLVYAVHSVPRIEFMRKLWFLRHGSCFTILIQSWTSCTVWPVFVRIIERKLLNFSGFLERAWMILCITFIVHHALGRGAVYNYLKNRIFPLTKNHWWVLVFNPLLPGALWYGRVW